MFRLLKYRHREDIIDDPVATSLNGYLHGSGSVGALMDEVDQWPLPFAAKFAILRHVTGGRGLENFQPLAEDDVENPLPGPFVEHPASADVASAPTPGRNGVRPLRRFEEVDADYEDVFPRKKARC
mmetsp:Transcript_28670/g.89364  ORF Transcript_28670/g.89364 Transcript_28670/m.89364 type:complete len:126 (+) Transcript_28670:545-922(+)